MKFEMDRSRITIDNEICELRRHIRKRRLRDRVAGALRARRFTAEETMKMGFGLCDFARRFKEELKDA
ncbi:MAG: hypothetical protein AB1665_07505 [Candidatus Thermoplasmatota archaeon]